MSEVRTVRSPFRLRYPIASLYGDGRLLNQQSGKNRGKGTDMQRTGDSLPTACGVHSPELENGTIYFGNSRNVGSKLSNIY